MDGAPRLPLRVRDPESGQEDVEAGDDGKVRWSPNPTAEVYVEPEDWDSPFQLF